MKRRAVFAAAMLAVAYVFSEGYALAKKPQFNGDCSSCGTPSVVNGGGVTVANTTTSILSNATGVYRITCYGGQRCTKAKVDESELRWVDNPDHPDSLSLFLGDVQVGAMHKPSGQYSPHSADQFGPPCEAPKPPPTGETKAIGATVDEKPAESVKAADGRELFFGVDPQKIKPAPANSINGKPVSPQEAYEALGEGGKTADIPDDCDKLSLTVVAAKEVREAVKKALTSDAKLSPLRPYLVEQYYEPTDPMIATLGYQSPVNVQDASGVMLMRSDDYSPSALYETVVGGLRKKRPDYDPAKDAKPGDGFSLDNLFKQLAGEKLFGWLVAGVLVLLGIKGKS